MRMKTIFSGAILTLMLLVLLSGSCSAHRLYVDVTDMDTTTIIEIEAYYGDGKPVKDGAVTVYGPDDVKLLTGKTDDEGRFSFVLDDLEDVSNITVEVVQSGHSGKEEWEIEGHTLIVSEDAGDGLPLYAKAIAGLGYLLGLAGFASLYIARKKKPEKEDK